MVAYHFGVVRLDTGRLVGHALVCPSARYAAVRWEAAELDRRHAGPLVWRIVVGELDCADWSDGLVPQDGSLSQLLVPLDVRRLVALRYVGQLPIFGAQIRAALDDYLEAVALPAGGGADTQVTSMHGRPPSA